MSSISRAVGAWEAIKRTDEAAATARRMYAAQREQAAAHRYSRSPLMDMVPLLRQENLRNKYARDDVVLSRLGLLADLAEAAFRCHAAVTAYISRAMHPVPVPPPFNGKGWRHLGQ